MWRANFFMDGRTRYLTSSIAGELWERGRQRTQQTSEETEHKL